MLQATPVTGLFPAVRSLFAVGSIGNRTAVTAKMLMQGHFRTRVAGEVEDSFCCVLFSGVRKAQVGDIRQRVDIELAMVVVASLWETTEMQSRDCKTETARLQSLFIYPEYSIAWETSGRSRRR